MCTFLYLCSKIRRIISCMKKFILISLCLILSLIGSQLIAQTYCTKVNKEACQAKLEKFQSLQNSPANIQEIAIQVGKDFLGTPYVAKTLELGDKEQLVIDLQGLDCTTFLENVLVFSRLAKQNKLDFESFQQELALIRYRDGNQGSYASRLHYFTEWIANNEQKGIIKDITAEIGGSPYPKQINFMSTHRSSYAQLSSDAFLAEIKLAEKRLNSMDRYYIPKASIQSLESGIKSGDLIAITTTIKGLDVSHVGMAIEKNGRIHLLHASTRSNKVEISQVPLASYLAKSKSQAGIMVCRLQEPA